MPKRTDIKKILIIGSAATIVTLFVSSLVGRAEHAEPTCDDVSAIDLKNGNLDLGGFGLLAFKEGRACGNEEVAVHQDRNCECDSGKCDWDMKVSDDIKLLPESNVHLRLVIVSEIHLTGSGAWAHLLLFECQGGRLHNIWDRQYLYGVKFIQTENGFELESNYWLPKDARCCPSKKQRETYRWSSRQHRYIRTRRVVLKHNA